MEVTMPKIRWGLLSTANINRRLIPAIRASERGELVAVASRSQSQADDYAHQWEIPHAFGSYQALLDSDLVDAVYISLPNHLHAEWSIRALQAGKHVLCEKPLAISVEEVDQMIAASQSSGKILAEAFMYLHHPQTLTARQWLLDGNLGEILSLQSCFTFKISNPDNVRLISEYGGGSMWDVGIYPVSFAMIMLGSVPEQVAASQWVGPTVVDEHFSGLMTFPGAVQAQIVASFRSPAYTYAEILGTAGRLVLNRPFIGMDDDRHLTFFPENVKPQEIPVPQKPLYLGEVDDMHAAILDGQPQYLPLELSRQWIKVLTELYRAANQHITITLDS
jgi:xylose dehydrogenase (NAD/NADP)